VGRLSGLALATLLLGVAAGEPALAQIAPSAPPPFRGLRYEERYSYLAAADAPASVVDPLKFLALDRSGALRLSLGGELRLRSHYLKNPVWGEEPNEPAAFFQRYMLHGDLWWKQNARVFLQFRSTFADGLNGGASPVDEDAFDLAQAFGEIRLPLDESREIGARVGRQEVRLGSERLVAVREGPNNRRRFDGFRVNAGSDVWQADALAMRPAEDDDGVFDDGTNRHLALWGLYVVGFEALIAHLNTDFYYLGYHDDDAAYEQGEGSETRHTVGTRLWGAARAWDWNWELAYQFGRFAGGDIEAWTVATDTGYTFSDLPWSPRLACNANVASGDRNAENGDLQTFNPLFPRGNYFSHLALLGPRNFFNVHPGIAVLPTTTIDVALDVNLFWRLSRSDGLYGPSGNLLRASDGSRERFAGTALSASAGWGPNRYLRLEAVYTHVFPGPFIRDTGPNEQIDFLELTMTLRY